MKQTELTLLEQMRIDEFDIAYRKELLGFDKEDCARLKSQRSLIESNIENIVKEFYQQQTSFPEIALLIGDAATLDRLQRAQRQYILDLFSGVYDINYVNDRLRIGMVHKRIGVEPRLYLAAIINLKKLIYNLIRDSVQDQSEIRQIIDSLEKLFQFDITLVFETYIRSLVSEIQIAKDKTERYSRDLEEKIKERTAQIEELMRTDPLTGLLNVRYLVDTLTIAIRAAQRQEVPVTFVFLDVDRFKQINDTQGHPRGDAILQMIGNAIKKITRIEDYAFRYGGDEFCIVLNNCTEDLARDVYIVRLNAEIELHEPGLRISSGIIQTGPHEFASPEALLRDADARMYEMKLKRHTDEAR
jgi:diguanylate cyclase (GGDEF)-like protein